MSTKISHKKVILFDVDGTLSDSWKLGFTSTQLVLRNAGHQDITEEEYHQGTKYSTPRRFAWHLTNNPEDPIGLTLGNIFDATYVDLVSPETTALYDGIYEMLKNINSQNVQIGALSNACGAYVKAVLNVNKISEYFTIGLGADEVPLPKPAPDGLLQCCQFMDVQPNECIYVGDSPSDAFAATAAGMMSIGVTWGSHPRNTVIPAFTYTVDSVSELDMAINRFIATGSFMI
jgi:HAD superfamily hydrolase (TIGR01509 family)